MSIAKRPRSVKRVWRLDVGDEVPVVADPNRLAQALLQLADNAVKHTQPGDQIRIGTAARNGEPHLWVDDQGAEFRPKTGRQFSSVSIVAPTTTEDKGAGLGLAIVAAIAEAHGGSLTLEQRPGPGARFEITLPPAPSQPTVHHSARGHSR